jgi:hypothetical protein
MNINEQFGIAMKLLNPVQIGKGVSQWLLEHGKFIPRQRK